MHKAATFNKVGRSRQAGRRPRRASGGGDRSLTAYLRRRRARVAGLAVLAPLLVAITIVADYRGAGLYRGSDMQRYDGQVFAVARIVDGDTIHVQAPDRAQPTTAVRLWGIDTPEVARHDAGALVRPAEPFGDEARRFTQHACADAAVRLLLQPHQTRDKFGRLLAYVQLPEGAFLNEQLLREGLATADRRFSHDRFETYLELERLARQGKVGLWDR